MSHDCWLQRATRMLENVTGTGGLRVPLDEVAVVAALLLVEDGISPTELARRFSAICPTAQEHTDAAVLGGLELGADDDVTKPFNQLELLARIKAVLRRLDMPSGDAEMDFTSQQVRVKDAPVALTPTQYKLLYHLVRNAGHTLTPGTLLAKVQAREYRDEVDYLRVYARRLLDKLRDDPEKPCISAPSAGSATGSCARPETRVRV